MLAMLHHRSLICATFFPREKRRGKRSQQQQRAGAFRARSMASRARKRIHALQRAPNGSAFQKCEHCGTLIAIALVDMHECGPKREAKRSKVEIQESFSQKKTESEKGLNIDDQPRSPFCCFMESFKETCKAEKLLDINQRGFDAWKNMSEEERHPYVVQAERVDSAYLKILLEESNDMSEGDDEADSVMVGKFDPGYTETLNYSSPLRWMKFKRSEGGYKDPLNYEGSLPWSKFKSSDSFVSYEYHDWDELDPRFDDLASLKKEDHFEKYIR